jgi:hypothetical protein
LQTPTEGERHIETYRVDQYVGCRTRQADRVLRGTIYIKDNRFAVRSRARDLSLKAGAPLKVVSERLGHAQLSIDEAVIEGV